MDLTTVSQGVAKRKLKRRVGRGIGSGQGKTAGLGMKGQYASAGARLPSGLFEGGQMPLFRRWPKRGITCYRLYERDVPDVPVIVDRYEDYLHIVEYERPTTRTAAQQDEFLDAVADAAAAAVELPRQSVFVKSRPRQRSRAKA